MDVRLLGDDNREIKIQMPSFSGMGDVKKFIAEQLLVPAEHSASLHLQKIVLSGDSDSLVDMFESDMDDEQRIALSDYLQSGDTIFVSNVSSFSDPNVWKTHREWTELMAVKNSGDISHSVLMPFIELLARVCENIVGDPHNEKYRHINYEKVSSKIEHIPHAMALFKCLGFVKQSEKDFHFVAMHTLQPLRLVLQNIYVTFPELRPQDTKFLSQFASFDAKEQKFNIEKERERQQKEEQFLEKKRHFQSLTPNTDTMIKPSFGTKIAQAFHVVLENIVLVVILVPIAWWLFKGLFWPYFQ